MAVCQTSDYRQNSGPGFSIVLRGRTGLYVGRERIAGVLSRPSYGLTAPGPMATAASRIRELEHASTDSPVGRTRGLGQMHQHFCDDVGSGIPDHRQHGGPGAPLRGDNSSELPQKGWPGGPGAGPEPRRVFSTKIHVSVDGLGNPLRFILTGGQQRRITQAGGVDRRLCWRAYWPTKGTMPRSFASTSWNWV